MRAFSKTEAALDETRAATAQITGWCIIIAMHDKFGIGPDRLQKFTDVLWHSQKEHSASVILKGRAAVLADLHKRANAVFGSEMRVPLNRAPRTRMEEQHRIAANASSAFTMKP